MKTTTLSLSAAGLVALLVPFGALAAPGDLFEADQFSGTIFQFTPAGTKTTFASGLIGPSGLAFDRSGNLFEADQFSNTIFKFTPDGTKTIFASGLNGPTGLAFNASGNLFEADNFSGTIFKFTPDGTKTTFASGLNGPGGLAVNDSGDLFVAAFDGGTIFKFTPDGTKSTFASGLDKPTGLAVDDAGNLFAADRDIGTIFKFTPAGSKSTFASGLSKPIGLAVDGAGNLFEADQDSNSIFKFTPGGTKTTFATGLDSPQGLAFEPAVAELLNISTRLSVETGDNVLIGGFIITGTESKEVLVRGIGPSLSAFGLTGVLADPTLELHEGDGTVVTNDNWRDTQEQEIIDTMIPPSDDLESAIIATLAPGANTAILRGINDGTGIGLVEVYDLSQGIASELANISTRGFVQTGDNVMIGGIIVGGGNGGGSTIVVRAIGPSLGAAGVADPLQDPTLEAHNGDGDVVAFNDNWQDDAQQAAEIEAAQLAPSDNRESAIEAVLTPGNYTAIVRGANDTTGVALIEAYNLH